MIKLTDIIRSSKDISNYKIYKGDRPIKSVLKGAEPYSASFDTGSVMTTSNNRVIIESVEGNTNIFENKLKGVGEFDNGVHRLDFRSTLNNVILSRQVISIPRPLYSIGDVKDRYIFNGKIQFEYKITSHTFTGKDISGIGSNGNGTTRFDLTVPPDFDLGLYAGQSAICANIIAENFDVVPFDSIYSSGVPGVSTWANAAGVQTNYLVACFNTNYDINWAKSFLDANPLKILCISKTPIVIPTETSKKPLLRIYENGAVHMDGDSFGTIKLTGAGDLNIKYKLEDDFKDDYIYGENIRIRYIRDWLKGQVLSNGSSNNKKIWMEIEAIDMNGSNAALNKPVTLDPNSHELMGNLDMVVDGSHNNSSIGGFVTVGPENGDWSYVQIDLRKATAIDKINTWHYYQDSASHKTKLEISEDGKTWITLYDYEKDGPSLEDSSGKSYGNLRPIVYPHDGIRYIRDHIKKSSKDNTRKWLEIEVLNGVGENLALGKKVKIQDGYTLSSGSLGNITDGSHAKDSDKSYVQVTPEDGNYAYIEIDLEKPVCPKEIKVWHYNDDTIAYDHKLEVSADGVDWYTLWNSDLDGTYVERSEGKSYETPYPVIDSSEVRGVRYIRDWLRGNDRNNGRHWVQLKATDANNVNVAQGKKVSMMSGYTPRNSLQMITDGVTDTNHYVMGEPEDGQWCYIEVDLGEIRHDLKDITRWHYYADKRIYASRLEVSEDGHIWKSLYHSERDGKYTEEPDGKSTPVYPAKGTKIKTLVIEVAASLPLTGDDYGAVIGSAVNNLKLKRADGSFVTPPNDVRLETRGQILATKAWGFSSYAAHSETSTVFNSSGKRGISMYGKIAYVISFTNEETLTSIEFDYAKVNASGIRPIATHTNIYVGKTDAMYAIPTNEVSYDIIKGFGNIALPATDTELVHISVDLEGGN